MNGYLFLTAGGTGSINIYMQGMCIQSTKDETSIFGIVCSDPVKIVANSLRYCEKYCIITLPAKSGPNEGRVPEHGGAKKGAQPQGRGGRQGRAVVRRRQAGERGGRSGGGPSGLEGRVRVWRERRPIQVVTQGVSGCQRAGEGQTWRVALYPGLFPFSPFRAAVLEPDLDRR